MDFLIGSVCNEDQDIFVCFFGKIKNLDVLCDLVLIIKDGVFVYLEDVVEVYDFKKEIEIISWINGKNFFGILIFK